MARTQKSTHEAGSEYSKGKLSILSFVLVAVVASFVACYFISLLGVLRALPFDACFSRLGLGSASDLGVLRCRCPGLSGDCNTSRWIADECSTTRQTALCNGFTSSKLYTVLVTSYLV